MSRTRIKICGLTREADVDDAVSAGADALGFVLYTKSPRHVSLERAVGLAQRLPPFVTPVLLFVNASPQELRQAGDALPQALLQFHGDETREQCDAAALTARRLCCSTPMSKLTAGAGRSSIGH
jgi:phosphoribosylanthranilate isomerase